MASLNDRGTYLSYPASRHHASLAENLELFRGGMTINLKETTCVCLLHSLLDQKGISTPSKTNS